jgi:hypothetical protein
LRKAEAVVVAPLQLAILHGQVKMAVQVVEQLETMEAMQVRPLDWELRDKALTVDLLPHWVRGRVVAVVVQPVLVQHQLTMCLLRVKAEAEHRIRFPELQFVMQLVVGQEH